MHCIYTKNHRSLSFKIQAPVSYFANSQNQNRKNDKAEKQTKNECLEHISQKINADTKQKNNLFYRASFFGAGIKEICRLWLEKGCVESPKQMAELLLEEYKNRDSMF